MVGRLATTRSFFFQFHLSMSVAQYQYFWMVFVKLSIKKNLTWRQRKSSGDSLGISRQRDIIRIPKTAAFTRPWSLCCANFHPLPVFQTSWWTCWESWPVTASQSKSWSCSSVCWGEKTASGWVKDRSGLMLLESVLAWLTFAYFIIITIISNNAENVTFFSCFKG